MAMSNSKHTIFEEFNKLKAKVKGTLKESKFYKEGKLTPEEFVLAGDFLVLKCPSWHWCAAKESLFNKALPKEKQYLETRVFSNSRCSDYLEKSKTTEKEIEGGWIDADLGNNPKNQKKPEAIDLDEEEGKKKIEVPKGNDDDDDDFEIEGEEEIKEEKKNEEKNEEKKKEENVKIVQCRTYDVSVTYDFYYCVPRMWLIGYENGRPLTDEEMREDVMPEYRNKTCTIEPHSCTGIRNISVHPCRHSMLLKKMIDDFQNSGKKLEVEMSIILFLKFLQSVVPTVHYDFTMDISF